MNQILKILAKNAKPLVALTLLAGLVFMVTGPLAGPTTPKPEFTLSISATQTATRGGAPVSYTVTVNRTGGFAGPVALKLDGMPKGVTGAFQPNGQDTYSVPGAVSTVQVNLTATAASDPGTRNFHVKGTGCKSGGTCTDLNDDVEGKIAIVNPATPNFGLSTDKNPLKLGKPGAKGDLQVKFDGLGGFTGPVTLSLSGLPAGTTGTFDENPLDSKHDHSKLTIRSSKSTPSGTYVITVSGVGTPGTRSVTFTLIIGGVTGVVNFTIAGGPTNALHIGNAEPIDLALTNANGFNLYLDSLTIAVAGTNQLGCGAENFSPTQISSSAFPITVPPGTSNLSTLISVPLPTVTWINLPQPQNACLGATINFSYAGSGSDTP